MKAFLLTDQKHFMNQLLRTELFDHFLLSEAVIRGNITYEIDGHLNDGFYQAEELEALGLQGLSYLPYGQLREHCFSIIKGKQTPIYFKFVFLLSPENARKTLESVQSPFTTNDVAGIFLNLTFSDGRMVLTTGVSYKTFQLDHSFDQAWDSLCVRFLNTHQIAFEEL